MQIAKRKQKGFTLLEILLVIAAIGILAAIVLVAINPTKQLAQARNAERRSEVNTIYKALEQYLIDTGNYPTGITTAIQDICINGNTTNCVNLGVLVPDYIAAIPIDPGGVAYRVRINTSNNRVSVFAINAELGQGIGINDQPWTPANISTALWLDAADSSTITLNGSTVSQWNDKSGNARHAAQATATNQPSYLSIGYNNRPTLSFDGSNDELDVSALSGTTFTIFGVLQAGVVSGEDTWMTTRIGSSTAGWEFGYTVAGTAQTRTYGPLQYNVVSPPFTATTPYLHTVMINTPITTIYSGINGSALNQNSGGMVSSSAGIRIGGLLGNTGAGRWDGLISEIVISQSTLSPTDRQQLEGYLAHKWGLTDKLPTNHPYKWDGTLFGGVNITDTDARTYIAAVETTDGQSLENATRVAIQNFITGAKADGIWDAIKSSNILAGARTLNGALVPLKGTAPTNFNFVSGDYNRKTGLVGNGSTKYLNSNILENSYPLNSEHLSVYASSLHTATNGPGYIGTPSSNITGFPTITQTRYASRQSSPTRNRPVSTAGLQGLSRSASTSYSIYGSGSALTIADASVSAGSSSVLIYNVNGTSFSNARIAFYSIGESLDLALLDVCVTKLMTNLGNAIP